MLTLWRVGQWRAATLQVMSERKKKRGHEGRVVNIGEPRERRVAGGDPKGQSSTVRLPCPPRVPWHAPGTCTLSISHYFHRFRHDSSFIHHSPFAMTVALGLEGSANKLGVGIISHPAPGKEPIVLANLRHTYNSPPGEGFLPKDVAKHHRSWVVRLVKQAMRQAGVTPDQLDCICYTKGPGMGAPLQSVAVAARTLSLMWGKQLVGVNHCVGRMPPCSSI